MYFKSIPTDVPLYPCSPNHAPLYPCPHLSMSPSTHVPLFPCHHLPMSPSTIIIIIKYLSNFFANQYLETFAASIVSYDW